MTDRTRNSLYYADDKDIYDILKAHNYRSKKIHLLKEARKRGMYLSNAESEEDIVKLLSRFHWDWNQLETLVTLRESPSQRQRTVFQESNVSVSLSQLQQIVNEIKDQRSEQYDEVITFKGQTENYVEVSIQYSELDTTKTRLSQKTVHRASLEIDLSGASISIRTPDIPKAKEITEQLLGVAEKLQKEDTPSVRKTVSVEDIKNADLRTEFFTELVNGIDGCQVDDVSKLKLAILPKRVTDELENGADDNDQQDDEFEMSEHDKEFLDIVKSVAFEGRKLLTAKAFHRFRDDGYFLSSIIWSTRETGGEGRLIEIEAGFTDSPRCSKFSYKIKGYKNQKEPGVFVTTRKKLSAADNTLYSSKIESAAFAAQEHVTTKYQELMKENGSEDHTDEDSI